MSDQSKEANKGEEPKILTEVWVIYRWCLHGRFYELGSMSTLFKSLWNKEKKSEKKIVMLVVKNEEQ